MFQIKQMTLDMIITRSFRDELFCRNDLDISISQTEQDLNINDVNNNPVYYVNSVNGVYCQATFRYLNLPLDFLFDATFRSPPNNGVAGQHFTRSKDFLLKQLFC